MCEVSIVTVGMNHLPFLEQLYKSIYFDHNPSVEIETIYVDNCSNDGSVNYLKANYPQVKILKNESIKGFGENNNSGVAIAKGKYIAIINPDIRFLDKSIDILHEYMINNPNTGIVVPQLLNEDMSVQYSVRLFHSLKIIFFRLLFKGKDSVNNRSVSDYLQKKIDVNAIQYVNWAMGAAFFMSKTFYVQLGGFDNDYFLYVEDEDLCLRSWKNNRSVVYNPYSMMIHNHQRGSSKISKKAFIHLKSLFIFFRKHGFHLKDYRNYKNE